MAKKLYDLVVSTGSYTNKQGEEKKQWLTIGTMFEGDKGSPFVVLKRAINLAGLPFKDGSDSVMVSCFEPREDDRGAGRGARPPSKPRHQDVGVLPF